MITRTASTFMATLNNFLMRGTDFSCSLSAPYSVFALVILCFAALPVSGQDEIGPEASPLFNEAPTLRFESLSLAEGLSQASGNTLMQDKKGFIWISTQGGLHRWDGQEFKVFSSIPFDTTSLSDTWVWSATEASDGDLWVATAEAGLNKLDPETGKAKHYRHDPEDSTSISADFTFYTLEASNGDIWVSTLGAGLNRMRKGEEGIFTHIRSNPENPSDPKAISSDAVYWLSEDSEGNIWAGGNNGINKINPETEEVTKYLNDTTRFHRYGEPYNVLGQYLPPGNQGIMWIATGAGLVRFNTSSGEHRRFLIEETEEPSQLNFIHEVKPDPSDPNILWVAGPGTGVARFDIRTEKFTSYRNDPKDGNSLRSDVAVSLFLDRTGMMWVGTATDGVNIFNPGAVNFRHIKHDTENTQSLAPGSVWGVHEDSEGSLWVGTDIGANRDFLTHFDANTGKIKRYQHDPSDPQSLQRGNLRSFAEDGSDRFWVAGSGGLSILDRASGRFKRILRSREEIQEGLRSIFAVIPDKYDGDIFWVGSAGGLERFNTNSEEFSRILLYQDSSKFEPAVLSLLQDTEGTVWAGTSDGLFSIDPASGIVELASTYTPNDTTTISSNSIRCVTERAEEPGVLWLAAGNNGGLNRYDTKTGIATHYFKKDGLADNTVYGILSDENGGLWISTNGGISNYDPDSDEFRNYGLDDGLMALEYNQNGYSQGYSGVLYFGSGNGVTAFEPEYLNTNTIPPQVSFTDFKLFNKSLEPGTDSPLKQPVSQSPIVNLSHDENEIEIDFVALHFSNPKKNQYRYKLEGFDTDWVEAGTKTSAAYTNLPPGNFTFRVIASNSDGVWNEEGASLQINVAPPWYRTWAAYIGFVLLLGLMVFAVDRLQRARISRKEKERAALREAELRAEAENKRRADTEELSKIGQAITSSLSIHKIIDTVYENVNALMDAAIFSVGIYNDEKKRLEFPATKEEGVVLSPYSNYLDEDHWLSVWCFKNKEVIVIGEFEKEYSRYLSSYSAPLEGKAPVSLVYMPLILQGKAIGVITTQSFSKEAYSEYHVNLLRNLANYAAIALDNASAYRKLDATLSELQSTQEQLVQQEKMASLGELTAGIAHEIQNPLNFVNNFSDVNSELIEEIKEELEKGNLEEVKAIAKDLQENEMKITHHGKRAEEIVRSMLQHSRGGEAVKEATDLNALADEYLRLSYHGLRAKDKSFNAEFEIEKDESIPQLEIVPQEIGRVLLNLINNAFFAVNEKRRATDSSYHPTVKIKTRKVGNNVEVSVSDNGTGIPEKVVDKIFQPFFTTKATGQGTGLGLSMSYETITKGHGGRLEVDSVADKGTTFTIILPI